MQILKSFQWLTVVIGLAPCACTASESEGANASSAGGGGADPSNVPTGTGGAGDLTPAGGASPTDLPGEPGMSDPPGGAGGAGAAGETAMPNAGGGAGGATPMTPAVDDDGRPEKPNFVIILADDLGWQDVGVYDDNPPATVFETPHLDALATEGVRFTQGYSAAPTCAPSRIGILSGKHPARVGKTHVQGGAAPKPWTNALRMLDMFYTGRMDTDEVTIAEALAPHGYHSGHTGKWHVAVNHSAFPQPTDQGFDFSRSDLGVSKRMVDRLTGFATTDPNDEYRLDENGFAHDQTTHDALEFMDEANALEKPFFTYYAAWLVHTPILTRTERLLQKYAEKMGYDYPLDGNEIFAEGQLNPYYGAMVETYDYHVNQLVSYLKETDDPRWPGHQLIDNTYVFITSDNGGMERVGENITDNYPLDRGKIRAEEGGVRVPFIVLGPNVQKNQVSDVMVNGLDFYPTMLSLAGVDVPAGLDGADLSKLLKGDVKDPTLVTDASGEVRDTMYWHFPHGSALHSTIRKGGWKLFRNYDHVDNASLNEYRLYRLYNDDGSRNDIEEANDLAAQNPEVVSALSAELNSWLGSFDAKFPHYNPNTTAPLRNKQLAPAVQNQGHSGGVGWVNFQSNGAAVVRADLLYTLNGGVPFNEEWFRVEATLNAANGRAEAPIPAGTTHFLFNLIDENNFLVSSVDVGLQRDNTPDSMFVPAYEP